MDRQRFWSLIEASRKTSKGNQVAHVEALRELLQALSVEELVSFHDHYCDCASRVDQNDDVYVAAAIIDGFCVSDDAFEYFGDWLISKGEQVFEDALRDPESLVGVVEPGEVCEFEEFSSVAVRNWEEKTGRSMEEMPVTEVVRREDSESPAWKDDADLERRFPRLWARFSAHGR